MVSPSSVAPNIVGRRIRARRQELGWSQEKLGVAIGIEESSSRARISRYELGTHEPPVKTARLIAAALEVPMTYLYSDDDQLAEVLTLLSKRRMYDRRHILGRWLTELA